MAAVGKLQITFEPLKTAPDTAAETAFTGTESQPLLEDSPNLGFHGAAVPRSLDPQPGVRHRIEPSNRQRRHHAPFRHLMDFNASNAAIVSATLLVNHIHEIMIRVNNIVVPASGSCPFCAFLRREKPYTILRRSGLVAILVTREQRGTSHLLVVPVRRCRADYPSNRSMASMVVALTVW